MADQLQAVCELLKNSLSPVGAVRQPAEQQIIQYRQQPGFATYICGIISNTTIPLEIRIAAAIQLKQCICNHWTEKPNQFVIPKEEKASLRSAVIQLIADEQQQIASLTASSIAYMVATDFPDVWPDFFSTLVSAIQTQQSPLGSHRLLMTLNLSLKSTISWIQAAYDVIWDDDTVDSGEQADVKKKALRELAPTMATVVMPIWYNSTQQLLSAAQAFAQGNHTVNLPVDICWQCLYSIKVLRRVFGLFLPYFAEKNKASVDSFFANVLSSLQALLQCRDLVPQFPHSPSVEKLFLSMCNLVIQVQSMYPLTFVDYLEHFLSFFIPLLDRQDMHASQWNEQITIRAIRFLENVFGSEQYVGSDPDTIERILRYTAHSKFAEHTTRETLIRAQQLMARLFPEDKIVQLTRIVILRLLSLTPSDLQMWENAPEELIQEDITDFSDFRISAAADLLWRKLLRYKPELVGREVISTLKACIAECARPADQVPMEAILRKDACYNAIASGYNLLSGIIDIRDLFVNVITPDMKNPDPRYKTIRRRIGFVLQAWVMEIPEELTPDVYRVCVALFEDPDLMVRVSAVILVRNIVTDPLSELVMEQFAQYSNPIMTGILRLVNEMMESDTARHILRTVSYIITAIKEHVRPYAPELIRCVSSLWASSVQKQLIQSEIGSYLSIGTSQKHTLTAAIALRTVGIISALTQALPSEDVAQLDNVLLPLLQMGTDLSNPSSLYLLEESRDLWYNAMQRLGVTPFFVSLLARLSPIYMLEPRKFDHISSILRIFECYILLAPPDVVQANIHHYATLFEQLVDNAKKPLKMELVTKQLLFFVQTHPTQLPALVHVYKKLFALLFEEKTGVDSKIYISTVFLRTLMVNKEFVYSFFQQHIQAVTPPMHMCMPLWLDLASKLSEYQTEKAWVCCLSSLLAAKDMSLVQFIPAIVDTCANLLLDIHQKLSRSRARYRYSRHDDVIVVEGALLDQARKRARTSDPAAAKFVVVQDYFLTQLRMCIAANSDIANFEQQLFASVANETNSLLKQPLSAPPHEVDCV